MNREDERFPSSDSAILDEAITGLRNEELSQESLDASRVRSWSRILTEAKSAGAASLPLTTCEDFRATFADYRAGRLPEPRRLLVEDHTHTCVGCRKALQPRPEVVALRRPAPVPEWRRFAIAAALAVSVGLAGWQAYGLFGPIPEGSRATVQSLKGSAYKVAGGTLQLLRPGDELQEGETVRTAPSSQAFFRMRDGSVVEASERAEFRFQAGQKDNTIALDRGTVIVQAAKRRSGHLYVSSSDCRVSVTGTVFAVTRGDKGSRVSVVEGEVQVASSGTNSVLHPGDQVATHSSLGTVPIEKEIAWSQNLTQHLQLLHELTALKAKLETVRLPGLRYSSRLLDQAPVDSVLVLSIPNLGSALGEARRLFEEQLEASPVLKNWWGNAKLEPDFRTIAESFEKISSYLGDEILVTVSENGAHESPVMVAEVHRSGLDQVLKAALLKLTGGGEGVVAIGDEAVRAAPGQLIVALRNNRLVIASSAKAVDDAFARAAAPSAAKFTATEFGRQMQSTVQQGVGILMGANLQALVSSRVSGTPSGDFERMSGLSELRFLIAEQKQIREQTQYSAWLTFAGPRQGAASWAAAPAAMGSLSFVSPDAQFAAAAVFKKPDVMLDELLSFQPELRKFWTQLDQAAGVRFKNEVAAALGGEISIAVDGPMLPVSWKVVLDVSDARLLQASLETMVKSLGKLGAEFGGQSGTCRLDKDMNNDAPGGASYAVRCDQSMGLPEVHYAYLDGYVVFASNRAVLIRSVENRRSGQILVSSEKFKSLLPRDANANFSAMVYQNAGDWLGRFGSVLPNGQNQAIGNVAQQLKPMLVCAYAQPDNIQIVSKSSAWDLVLTSLLGSFSGGNFSKLQGTARSGIAYP